MKKIISLFLAILMALPVLAGGNDYRKKVRELKRGKWELYNSTQTLESALKRHYEALDREGVYEISGTAEGVRSSGLGMQVAAHNASIRYVTQVGQFLRGRIASDAQSGGDAKDEFNHFYAAYESLLQKEIGGELRHSFTLVRPGKKRGTLEMVSYFIVDEEQASRARIKALELAASESAAAQRMAESIRTYVDEGFAPVDDNTLTAE